MQIEGGHKEVAGVFEEYRQGVWKALGPRSHNPCPLLYTKPFEFVPLSGAPMSLTLERLGESDNPRNIE